MSATFLFRRRHRIAAALALALACASAGEVAPAPPAATADPAIQDLGAAAFPAAAAADPGADGAGGAAPTPGDEAQRRERLAMMGRATPVRLPAGALSLGAAIALLDASGNPTHLVGDADPAQVAQLDGMDGDYWQALIAVCAAFDLVPVPSPAARSAAGDRPRGVAGDEAAQRFAVQLGSGPLSLGRRPAGSPALLASVAGVVMVVVDGFAVHELRGGTVGAGPARWADLRLRLLAEPRIPGACLGAAVVDLVASDGESGRAVAAAGTAGEEGGDGILSVGFPQLAAGMARLRIAGRLTVAVAETAVLHGAVHPGASAVLAQGGTSLTVRLIDAEAAKRESRHGPALVCAYADGALVGHPHLRLETTERQLVADSGDGGELDQLGDGWEQTLAFAKEGPLESQYAVAAEVRLPVGKLELPLDLLVDFTALPRDEAPPAPGVALQRPTTLSWPAAEMDLQQALAALRAGGNQVLLELDADESRHAAVPAFAGSFWEGVLTVCRAFDLTVLPSADGVDPEAASQDGTGTGIDGLDAMPVAVDGGTVCLGRLRGDRPAPAAMNACGTLLTMVTASSGVVTRSRAGVERVVNLACRMRLEPRLAAYRLREPMVAWNAFAEAQGRALTVRRPLVQVRPEQHEEDPQGLFPVAAKLTDPWTVAVAGLPAGAAQVGLGGLFVAQLDRPERVTLTLAPGQHRAVMLGGHALEVAFLDRAQAQGQGMDEPAVSVLGADGLAAGVQLELRTAAGERIAPHATDTREQHGIEYLWSFPDVAIAAYTLVISGAEPVAAFSQPVLVRADVR
jgi:hypothetical protein